MSDNNQPAETNEDFDAAYEEFIGSDEQTSDDLDASHYESEEVEAEEAQPEEPAPAEQPKQDSDEAGNATEAESAASESQPEEQPEDLEKLRQKLKSAEGRLSKFEESVEEMREKLNKQQPEPSEPPPTKQDTPAADDGEFVPPGMDKDDWLDLQEDYPDTAKALKDKFQQEQSLEAENRELKTQQEQEAQQLEAQKAFRKEILDAHPNYDTEIAPKLDDVQTFINEQTSAVAKQQYQRIFDAGTASEVNALISDYKEARSSRSEPEPTDTGSTPDKRINDALAVPNKGGGDPNLDKGSVDMDDFDAAYEEALKLDND